MLSQLTNLLGLGARVQNLTTPTSETGDGAFTDVFNAIGARPGLAVKALQPEAAIIDATPQPGASEGEALSAGGEDVELDTADWSDPGAFDADPEVELRADAPQSVKRSEPPLPGAQDVADAGVRNGLIGPSHVRMASTDSAPPPTRHAIASRTAAQTAIPSNETASATQPSVMRESLQQPVTAAAPVPSRPDASETVDTGRAMAVEPATTPESAKPAYVATQEAAPRMPTDSAAAPKPELGRPTPSGRPVRDAAPASGTPAPVQGDLRPANARPARQEPRPDAVRPDLRAADGGAAPRVETSDSATPESPAQTQASPIPAIVQERAPTDAKPSVVRPAPAWSGLEMPLTTGASAGMEPTAASREVRGPTPLPRTEPAMEGRADRLVDSARAPVAEGRRSTEPALRRAERLPIFDARSLGAGSTRMNTPAAAPASLPIAAVETAQPESTVTTPLPTESATKIRDVPMAWLRPDTTDRTGGLGPVQIRIDRPSTDAPVMAVGLSQDASRREEQDFVSLPAASDRVGQGAQTGRAAAPMAGMTADVPATRPAAAQGDRLSEAPSVTAQPVRASQLPAESQSWTPLETASPPAPEVRQAVSAPTFVSARRAQAGGLRDQADPRSDDAPLRADTRTETDRSGPVQPAMPAPTSAAPVAPFAIPFRTGAGAERLGVGGRSDDGPDDIDLQADAFTEFAFTTGRVTQGGAPMAHAAAMSATHRADVPAPVRQVAEGFSRLADGSTVEIRLSPDELGRVRMILHAGEHGMTVNIQADRPETLDLMRRNVDELARNLADAGYEGAGFSFGEDRKDNRDAPFAQASTGPLPAETLPQLPEITAATDGLDIRI